jgi:hypothetical protein
LKPCSIPTPRNPDGAATAAASRCFVFNEASKLWKARLLPQIRAHHA